MRCQFADKNDDIQQQQADSKFESKKNTSIAVVSFERYPNRKEYKKLNHPWGTVPSCFLSDTSRTIWATEEPTVSCHLLLPDNFPMRRIRTQAPIYMLEVKGLCALNNLFMVFKKIKNEYDHNRTDYMKNIKEFDLNHIMKCNYECFFLTVTLHI